MNFTFPLIDGSFAVPLAPAGRTAIVERMAADLVRFDAFQDERDAIRCLMAPNLCHSAFHVLRFVDDARQVAMQDVVAKEMSKP